MLNMSISEVILPSPPAWPLAGPGHDVSPADREIKLSILSVSEITIGNKEMPSMIMIKLSRHFDDKLKKLFL